MGDRLRCAATGLALLSVFGGVTPALAAPQGSATQSAAIAGAVQPPPVRRADIRLAAIAAGKIRPIAAAEVSAFLDRLQPAVETALANSGASVRRQGATIVVEMPGDVSFGVGKHYIQPPFRKALDALARTLTRHTATFVDVNGYTDSAGSRAANRALSERRALAVATYLELGGVFTGRLDAQGFGEAAPKQSNATSAGRAANRRVEIVLTPYTG